MAERALKTFTNARSPSKARQFIVLFGSGTLGHAVTRSLAAAGYRQASGCTSHWENPAAIQKNLAEVAALTEFTVAKTIHYVFAAGRAGFAAQDAQTSIELAAWLAILASIADHRSQLTGTQSQHVHLLSSAGGLFEGQVGVSASAAPAPLRAYGHLKQAQEQRLLAHAELAACHIYRLSSVYGASIAGHRGSLVTNLLANCFAHRVTPVTGSLATLRDYIHADDVARYITRRIQNDTLPPKHALLLASARSTSIQEVLRIVERATRRKPLVALSSEHNSASNSFVPGAVAEAFTPDKLETNIGRMLRCHSG